MTLCPPNRLLVTDSSASIFANNIFQKIQAESLLISFATICKIACGTKIQKPPVI
eukprot:TRINITY_DN7319_c0_g1_i1.p2 TRINITY_DN7319_c0_g1~~TRINITY_DN7319_c0_g1_i1.p2  ORF type:complete len:55 (+),score=4.43 TRINITY_DN7319_c0_g1_i1:287-451(+)